MSFETDITVKDEPSIQNLPGAPETITYARSELKARQCAAQIFATLHKADRHVLHMKMCQKFLPEHEAQQARLRLLDTTVASPEFTWLPLETVRYLLIEIKSKREEWGKARPKATSNGWNVDASGKGEADEVLNWMDTLFGIVEANWPGGRDNLWKRDSPAKRRATDVIDLTESR